MEETKIRAVVKEPSKEAQEKEIEVSLEKLQGLVKGLIEIVPFPGKEGLDIVLNEEGKLINMEPNVYLPEYSDMAVGPIVVIGFGDEQGEHRGLTEEEITKVKGYLEKNDARTYKGNIQSYFGFDSHIR